MRTLQPTTPLANASRDAREAAGASAADFAGVLKAIELEALFALTVQFWRTSGITDAPTSRVRWYWFITEGHEPEPCHACGSRDWSWSSCLDCSECTPYVDEPRTIARADSELTEADEVER